MARPSLVLGTWGKVSRSRRGTAWVAEARFRDFDGVTRRVERKGATGRQAEDALLEHLRDRTRTHGADMTGDTKVRDLATQWLDVLKGQGRATGTVIAYRRALERHILPALGDIRLREASVPIVERFVTALTTSTGYGSAKTARVVLNAMFSLAVRHGAVASNPVRDTASVQVPRREVQTIGLEEVVVLRARLATWDAGTDRPGYARTTELADVIDMLLATGVRTGELLALRWSDVSLDEKHPTVDIAGTVVSVPGEGLTLQPRPKTTSSFRRLQLPPFAAAMLRARQEVSKAEYVFPSSVGTLRSPNNLRRQWRDFRDHYGYESWMTPKTFRKAVATLIRDDVDLDTAAEQLGHSSSTVTRRHYAARLAEGPDVTSILQQFGSSSRKLPESA